MLFQAQRDRAADGRIVATVHDYANAYYLASDVFSEALRSVPKRTHDILLEIDKLYIALTEIQAKGGDSSEVTVGSPELMAAAELHQAVLSRLLRAGLASGRAR